MDITIINKKINNELIIVKIFHTNTIMDIIITFITQ